jgi:hypothetical protein
MNNPTSPCGFNLFSLKLNTLLASHYAPSTMFHLASSHYVAWIRLWMLTNCMHAFIVHLLMIMCSNNYVLSYSNATMFTCHNISMFQTLHFLLSRWNTSTQCTEPITLITSHHQWTAEMVKSFMSDITFIPPHNLSRTEFFSLLFDNIITL